LKNSALVLFEVTENYSLSKYRLQAKKHRLQALIFKIPASAKLAVKYRPSGHRGDKASIVARHKGRALDIGDDNGSCVKKLAAIANLT